MEYFVVLPAFTPYKDSPQAFSMLDISVVIAVYNEEENVKPLLDQVHAALSGMEFEIVLVNDGSTDQTIAEAKKYNSPHVKLVQLMKNYGQSSAMSAGIDVASGAYIVTMDGDLQNDPSDIPAMLQLAKEGEWDLVAGTRANRKDGMFLRKVPSRIANRIIRRSTGVRIKDYGCSLKVFTADIAKNMGMYGELHRFIPVLVSMQGGTITQMDVKHHARQFGQSKYGIGRTFRVVADLMLMLFMKKWLARPIHLFGKWGMFVLLPGIGIDIYLLIEKIMGEPIMNRSLTILGVLLTLGGIQLITFGIVTELQMRTYYESQGKKPYRIRNIFVGKNKVN